MTKAEDLFAQLSQYVKELEDQIHGHSPLEAQLRHQQAQLQTVAQSLSARLTEVESREASLSQREAKAQELEGVLEQKKTALKEIESALLKKK